MEAYPLARALEAAAKQKVTNPAAVQALLEEMVADAKKAWPWLKVDAVDWVTYLAERLPPGRESLELLHALHASDLALAHACAQGDRFALATFDAQFMSQVDRYLARTLGSPSDVDEAKQVLRERLLVGKAGALPRIAGYSGRGPLAGWLRMAAARVAVDLQRQREPEGVDDATFERLAGTSDPEMERLKKAYGAELKGVFQGILKKVPAREASLLRLHFIDGMGADAIGRIYGVHGRTVQRWIATCRDGILAETRRTLSLKLGLKGSSLDSAIRFARSQLKVSISQVLSKATRAEP